VGILCVESRRKWVGLNGIRGFMRGHVGGSVSMCGNALKAVWVFFRDFLGRGRWWSASKAGRRAGWLMGGLRGRGWGTPASTYASS